MINPQALQFAQALCARSAQQPFQGTPWADPPRPRLMQPPSMAPRAPVNPLRLM